MGAYGTLDISPAKWRPYPPHRDGAASTHRVIEGCGCMKYTQSTSKHPYFGLCVYHAETLEEGYIVDLSQPPLECKNIPVYRGSRWHFGDDNVVYLMIKGQQPQPFDEKGGLFWFNRAPDTATLQTLWINAWLTKLWELGPTIEEIARMLQQARQDTMADECVRLAQVLLGQPTPLEQAAIRLFSVQGKQKGSGAFNALRQAVQKFLASQFFRSFKKPPQVV